MALFACDTNEQFKRAIDLQVYGFVPGPETTTWSHVKNAWVWDDSDPDPENHTWKRLYKAGMAPPTLLSIAGNPAGGDWAEFTANFTPGEGQIVTDYEIGGWYDWSTEVAVQIEGAFTRVITIPSAPSQMHRLTFTIRAKADPAWGNPPGPYVESPQYYWKDPRDPF